MSEWLIADSLTLCFLWLGTRSFKPAIYFELVMAEACHLRKRLLVIGRCLLSLEYPRSTWFVLPRAADCWQCNNQLKNVRCCSASLSRLWVFRFACQIPNDKCSVDKKRLAPMAGSTIRRPGSISYTTDQPSFNIWRYSIFHASLKTSLHSSIGFLRQTICDWVLTYDGFSRTYTPSRSTRTNRQPPRLDGRIWTTAYLVQPCSSESTIQRSLHSHFVPRIRAYRGGLALWRTSPKPSVHNREKARAC